MTTQHIAKFRLLVLVRWGRRIASKRKPEIKLLTLLVGSFVTAKFIEQISSTLEWGVCIWTIYKKYF